MRRRPRRSSSLSSGQRRRIPDSPPCSSSRPRPGADAASCAAFGGRTWTLRKAYSSYDGRSPIFRAGLRSARPRQATSGKWRSTLRRCPCSRSFGNEQRQTTSPSAPRLERTRTSGPHRPTACHHFAPAVSPPVRTVAGRLGHSRPTLTLQTYAHVMEVTDRRAAEIASRSISDLGPAPD